MTDYSGHHTQADEDIADWLQRGRALLSQLEALSRTHQEMADDYRAQCERLRGLLTNHVQEPQP